MQALTMSALIGVAIVTTACNTTEQRICGAAAGAGTGAAVAGQSAPLYSRGGATCKSVRLFGKSR